MEEFRLMVFDKEILREVTGSSKEKYQENGGYYVLRNFIISNLHLILRFLK
jgi:hypothetical protein